MCWSGCRHQLAPVMESAEMSYRSIGMKWTWVTPDKNPIYLSSLEPKAKPKSKKHIHCPGSQIPQMWLQKTLKIQHHFPARKKKVLFKRCYKKRTKIKLVIIRSFYAYMHVIHLCVYTCRIDHSLPTRNQQSHGLKWALAADQW